MTPVETREIHVRARGAASDLAWLRARLIDVDADDLLADMLRPRAVGDGPPAAGCDAIFGCAADPPHEACDRWRRLGSVDPIRCVSQPQVGDGVMDLRLAITAPKAVPRPWGPLHLFVFELQPPAGHIRFWVVTASDTWAVRQDIDPNAPPVRDRWAKGPAAVRRLINGDSHPAGPGP